MASHPHSPSDAHFEPDDNWKTQLRTRIQLGLQSLLRDARENQLTELGRAVTPEERKRLDMEFTSAIAGIMQLAKDQYKAELNVERYKRQWTAGKPMSTGWSTYLMEEQEHILDSIQMSNYKADAIDFEPDEEWKRQLKARIQLTLQSLVQDAKDSQLTALKKAPVTPEDLQRLDIEYKNAVASIQRLADDQYHAELAKERNLRRWIVGEPVLPSVSTALMAEQEHIMNTAPFLALSRVSNPTATSKTSYAPVIPDTGARASYQFVQPSELYLEENAVNLRIDRVSQDVRPFPDNRKEEKLRHAADILQQEAQKIQDEALGQRAMQLQLEEEALKWRAQALHIRGEGPKRHDETIIAHKSELPRTKEENRGAQRVYSRHREPTNIEFAGPSSIPSHSPLRSSSSTPTHTQAPKYEADVATQGKPHLRSVSLGTYPAGGSTPGAEERQRHRRHNKEPETSHREDAMEGRGARRKPKKQVYEGKNLEELERSLEEERRRREEEVRLKAADAKRKQMEAARKAEEVRRREEEANRKAGEARLREEEAQRKAEEARKVTGELKQKEEEVARKAEEAKRIEEEAKQKAAEAKKIADEALEKQEKLRKLEEETQRREREIQEREQALNIREEELKQREEEAKRMEACPSSSQPSFMAMSRPLPFPQSSHSNDILHNENENGSALHNITSFAVLPAITHSGLRKIPLAEQRTMLAMQAAKDEERKAALRLEDERKKSQMRLEMKAVGKAQECGQSETIISCQPMDALLNESNAVRSGQQQTQVPVPMAKTEEPRFAKATVVRFRAAQAQPFMRVRRVSGPTAPTITNLRTTAALAFPTQAISTATNIRTEGSVNTGANRKVTVEDVPDEEAGIRGQTLPVDSWLILDDASVISLHV